MKKNLNRIYFCLVLLVTFSCGKNQTVKLWSMDKSQCITIIDQGDHRFLINGNYDYVPNSNFVELDMNNVGSLGNAVHVCWGENVYEWSVVVNNSEVIQSTLDKSKFNFSASLPLDERGIATELKFRQDGCAIFDYYSMRLSSNQGAIVEIK